MSSLDMTSHPSNAAPLLADTPLATRDDDPRSMILQKIARALRDAGSGATNIESVVAIARISASRIVEEFGGMNGLVIVMVEQLTDSMLEPLRKRPSESAFEPQLLEFAKRVADTYSASHLRGLFRIALTDAVRDIGTGRAFYQRGPGMLMAELTRFFRRAHTAGAIRRADSNELASHFMALLRAGLDLSDIFPSDLSNALPRKESDVAHIVSVFRAGIGRTTCAH